VNRTGGLLSLAAATLAAASAFLGSSRAEEPPGTKKIDGKLVSVADGAELAFVPSGAFLMGAKTSARTEDAEAMPAHEVFVESFYIDVTEVTNGRYARFLKAIAEKGHASCPKDEPSEKDHRPLDWGTERSL